MDVNSDNQQLCPPQSLPDFPHSAGWFLSTYHNSIIILENCLLCCCCLEGNTFIKKLKTKQRENTQITSAPVCTPRRQIQVISFSNPPIYWNVLCDFPGYKIWGHLPIASSSECLSPFAELLLILQLCKWWFRASWPTHKRKESSDTLLMMISVPVKSNLRLWKSVVFLWLQKLELY